MNTYFLKTIISFAVVCFQFFSLYANNVGLIDVSMIKKEHPRVLVNNWDAVRRNFQSESVMKRWFSQLSCENEIESYSLRYVLAGDTASAYKAYEIAMSDLTRNKFTWGPQHYSKTLLSLGILYDWQYDWFTEEQREALLKLITYGLDVLLKDQALYAWHNMNQCLCGGGIAAAVAIANEKPQLASIVLNRIINCLNIEWYKPDGVTPEGPHYMNWSSLVLMSGLATLDAAFGNGFGFSEEKGLMGYGDFMMYSTIPRKGVSVKFSDCYINGSNYNNGQIFWLAKKFNRPDLADFILRQDSATTSIISSDYNGKVHQMVWFDPDMISDDTCSFSNLPLDKYFKGAELFVMRSSWKNKYPLFAAIKGCDDYRQADYFHRHTNTGTFFISALGEEWCSDLGLESYAIKEYNVQPRLYYKLRAEGHNCNIINPSIGVDNMGWNRCPVEKYESSEAESFAIVDMTPDYKDIVSSAKRGIKVFDFRRKILLQDEFACEKKQNLESYWFMHTEAGIEILNNGKSALLYRGDKRLYVSILEAPSDARFRVMEAKPLIYSKEPASRQDWCFDIKKLAIHSNSKERLRISVVFVPLREEEPIPEIDEEIIPLDEWELKKGEYVTVDSIMVNGKLIEGFGCTDFTYDLSVSRNENVNIDVVKDSDIEIEITESKSYPMCSIIKASKDGYNDSYYYVYHNEPSSSIKRNFNNDYLSWDESFSNHRWIAPDINPGNSSAFELYDKTTVNAVTIGFINQEKRNFRFRIEASSDGKEWENVYSGSSKSEYNTRIPFPCVYVLDKPVSSKYFRVVNIDENSFAIDVIAFHKSEREANDYIKNVFPERVVDLDIYNIDSLCVGDKRKMSVYAITNFGKKYPIPDKNIIVSSENNDIISIGKKDMIECNGEGETFLRFIYKYGNNELHLKKRVKVLNDEFCYIYPSEVYQYRNGKVDRVYNVLNSLSIDETKKEFCVLNFKIDSVISPKKVYLRLFSNKTQSKVGNVYLKLSLGVSFIDSNKYDYVFRPACFIKDYVDVDITEWYKSNIKNDNILSFKVFGTYSNFYMFEDYDYRPCLIVN